MNPAAAFDELVEVAGLLLGGDVEHKLVDHQQLVLLALRQNALVSPRELRGRKLVVSLARAQGSPTKRATLPSLRAQYAP